MGVLGIVHQDYSKKQFHSKANRTVNSKAFIPILEKNEIDEDVAKFNKVSTNDGLFNGWVRIYCGPDRSDLVTIEPSRMVRCDYNTTAFQITADLNLHQEYSLWMQIGGSICKRVGLMEYPLKIQDEFFQALGYDNASRRVRLEIDPEIKYLLRFYIGPADISVCSGVLKSGCVDILKGLVFPQWQQRYICIIGSCLFVFQGSTYMPPEIIELSGAEIIEHSPKYQRLILKILPKCYNSNNISTNNGNCRGFLNFNSGSVYNSTGSISSSSDRERVLFIGFEESWERDLWSAWLLEAANESSEHRRLDICNAGLQTIPEVLMQSIDEVEELLAGQNKLQEIGLKALAQFPHLQILRLPGNGFKNFPTPVLLISELRILDIADNSIDKIPDGISHLKKLEELRIDRNDVTELPNSLRYLRYLKSLHAADNEITKLPSFLLKSKTMGLVDMYASKPEMKILNNRNYQENLSDVPNNLNPPLTKVSLRANNLFGNVILGNYGLLTQLDVSENQIEVLDLSALGQLETLQCCRNKLVELTLNGSELVSLITGNNNLKKINIDPTPSKLRHLDVSYNDLDELPKWLEACHELRTLFANNNNITCLPERIFTSDPNSLHTLQLGYNKLKSLPHMPKRKLPLQAIFLQDNNLELLPENFFFACEYVLSLNLSSNRLSHLPSATGTSCLVERLYATKNRLDDSAMKTLGGLLHLRVLHAAYNNLTCLPMECIRNWSDLEELVLSGNQVQNLPENLSLLLHLKVLRMHSNKLQSTPGFARTTTLRVLDLAHNQLDKIDLVTLVPKKLQFLDISCNIQLQVDAKQLQVCQSQRAMSLVDVSGKNRSSLPTTANPFNENCVFEPPWKVGFSETAGSCSKLYISQLRLPNFCNTEGLFGMFDGELENTVPGILVKSIPKILLEERTFKETANEYMKYTLLSAHRELKQTGQKYGVCATLCHICREKVTNDLSAPSCLMGRRFVLRIATVGEATAYLIRKTGIVRLTPSSKNKKIGNSSSFPLVVPDPEIAELTLGENDEYLVICNKKLWEIMDIATVVQEIRSESNLILAAKRVQDLAQSFGAEENLSIIIIKFTNIGTDMDYLITELRQTVRKKPSSVLSGFCKCGCCCDTNNSCCHSAGSSQILRQFPTQSDRSSPSGQSDQTGSEINLSKSQKSDTRSTTTSRKSSIHKCIITDNSEADVNLNRGIRSKIVEEEHEETDSAMSEEQFKCWEYMLEQNTQLLFDKELNTISKAFTKNRNASISNLSTNLSNMIRPASSKLLSASSPQLMYNEIKSNPAISSNFQNNKFLSKQFGSNRAFQASPPGLLKSMKMHSTGRIPPIGGGPNAAYFGSLQRLMPYNLEYDFAIMRERKTDDDSLEHESRMRQYWGVATTEL